MKKKSMKSLVILVLMATLLFSTVVTANAYTTSSGVQNGRCVYNYGITTNTILNNTSKFNVGNSSQNSIVRIPINNTSTSKPAEVQQPQKPEKPAPSPVEVPVSEANTPSQDPKPNPTNPTPAVEDTSNAKHVLTAAEIEMVKYVNQARAEAGLQPLAIDLDLSYVARVKSKDMQDNNYFSHTSPTYGSPFNMMKNFGIKYRAAAENIAINSSVKGAHNAFMNSEGHRNNILNPRMTHIGIGIQNRHYTQMFIQK